LALGALRVEGATMAEDKVVVGVVALLYFAAFVEIFVAGW
jgi:hypothetical protein